MPKLALNLILCFIALAGLYQRVDTRFSHDMTWDEEIRLKHVHGSWGQMLRQIPTQEYTSYLCGDIYLMFPFYHLFGNRLEWLMLPGLVANILMFVVAYWLARRFLRHDASKILFFILLAFNRTLIWHGLEIRQYAYLPAISLGVFALTCWVGERLMRLNLRGWIFSGLALVMAIWFHVYGILMVFISGLWAYLSTDQGIRRQGFQRWACFYGVVLAIAMPFWMFCVFGKHPEYQGLDVVFLYIPNPIDDFFGFMRFIMADLVGQKWLYPIVLLVPLALLLTRARRMLLMFMAIMVVLPLALQLTSHLNSGHFFTQRYFIWVMPYAALWFALSLDALITHLKKTS